jgi:hypothetical protein
MASERKNLSSRSRSSKRISARTAEAVRTRKSSRASVTGQTGVWHYAICVSNQDYPASLELRKLYPVLEDAFATQHGMMRVIDESGEDYLFPAEYFVRVQLPASVEKALTKIA